MSSMTRASKVALVALLTGLSSAVSAQLDNAAYARVSKVKAGNDNHLYVAVPGHFLLDHGCIRPYWAKSELEFDHAQTKAMLQIALASQLSRKPIHIYTVGCTSYGFPIFSELQIQEQLPPQNNGSEGSGNGNSNDTPPDCNECDGQPEVP